jgi:hypothetical protein
MASVTALPSMNGLRHRPAVNEWPPSAENQPYLAGIWPVIGSDDKKTVWVCLPFPKTGPNGHFNISKKTMLQLITLALQFTCYVTFLSVQNERSSAPDPELE